ncbi:hypothetical protein B5X24_HaOG214203 [Helicoverpa armigera]|nr:hypothetical protein B5X24_HaOG214203 [Helicoverpa armigera]
MADSDKESSEIEIAPSINISRQELKYTYKKHKMFSLIHKREGIYGSSTDMSAEEKSSHENRRTEVHDQKNPIRRSLRNRHRLSRIEYNEKSDGEDFSPSTDSYSPSSESDTDKENYTKNNVPIKESTQTEEKYLGIKNKSRLSSDSMALRALDINKSVVSYDSDIFNNISYYENNLTENTTNITENQIPDPIVPKENNNEQKKDGIIVAKTSNVGTIRKWDKKQACIFCSKLISKLPRHLESKHSKEPEVIKLTSLSLKSEERKMLIEDLKKKAYDILLLYRYHVGTPKENDYFFALPPLSHFRGSDVMRTFAISSGAKHPENLTSTKLKKNVATMSQILNLTNNELDQLATFMGHDIRVHREYGKENRLPESTVQLAKISKILIASEKGKLHNFKGKNLDEINININKISDDDESTNSETETNELDLPAQTFQEDVYEDHSDCNEKQPETNKISAKKKFRKKKVTTAKTSKKKIWTAEEKNVVEEYFGRAIIRQKVVWILVIIEVRVVGGCRWIILVVIRRPFRLETVNNTILTKRTIRRPTLDQDFLA